MGVLIFIVNLLVVKKLMFIPVLGIGIQCLLAQQTTHSEGFEATYPERFISKYEILIGPSIPYATGNEYVDSYRKLKVAFAASVGVSHPISRKFDLSLRLLVERKGSNSEYNSLIQQYTPPARAKFSQDLSLDYVGIGLMPRYFFGAKQKLYGGVGTYLNYLIRQQSATFYHRNDSLISHDITRIYSDFSYNTFDWGLTVEIGYYFRINSSLSWSVRLQGNFDLIDANKPFLLPTRLNSIALLIGVTINAKKQSL